MTALAGEAGLHCLPQGYDLILGGVGALGKSSELPDSSKVQNCTSTLRVRVRGTWL